MSIDVQKAKAEAHENAAKLVANMLQHPDHLDKVEQWRRRVMRNKASVEARLKTAVQSQLDGVRTGLYQLQSALVDIKEIKKSLGEVDDMCKNVTTLSDKLEKVKLQQSKQSQLSKACEHLNHIFTVPECVDRTNVQINEGKLLLAHKSLSDLEATRDELLFEVHKMSQADAGGSMTDKTVSTKLQPLYEYFANVNKCSEALSKQLWIVMGRILSTVRSDPAQLVTALRIIEREERADKRAAEKKQKTGFGLPGRPKKWKSKCFKVIEESVANRFESLEMGFEDRLTDKMWLVKHLERTRLRVLDDLTVCKTLCQPCFPSSYNIFDEYVKMYHKALSSMLEKIVCEQRLDSNGCVSILMWIKEYGGKDLMMHPELEIDIQFLEPLLSQSVHQELVETYISTTTSDTRGWMNKMIETDMKDWLNDSLPETDVEGFYNTSLPVFLFQMVDQNIQVAARTGEDLTLKILDNCLEEMQCFQREYRSAVRSYKSKHFEDRSEPQRFVEYMIAIANNCHASINFAVQMEAYKFVSSLPQLFFANYYTKILPFPLLQRNQMERLIAELGKGTFGEERQQIFKSILDCFQQIGREVCVYLLEEVFLDLQPYFAQLFTPPWIELSTAVETIVVTFEDYYRDYVHMKSVFLDYLVDEALKKVLLEYIRALMNKRIAFKNYEERRKAAEKVKKEALRIEETFNKLATKDIDAKSRCSVLTALVEVIKLRDTSMLFLEFSGIVKKYPDFKSDHAMALLLMRGDVTRAEAKQLILGTELEQEASEESGDGGSGFFSQIIVPESMLDKLESAMKKK